MVEWRGQAEEDIERSLETVSRITGSSSGGGIAAVMVYEVNIQLF